MNKLKAGQAHTEYALILALIGVTVVGALTLLGLSIHDLHHTITVAWPH